MTTLYEIRDMLEGADPADWRHIIGWGAYSAPVGYPLMTASDTDEQGQVTQWHLREYSDLLVFVGDVNLSIAYGLPVDPVDERNRRIFDWATSNDWSVELRIADVRWQGQIVDRVSYWTVDGGGAEVPIGKLVAPGDRADKDAPTHIVPAWEDAITRAISFAHGTLDDHGDYVRAAGAVVQ